MSGSEHESAERTGEFWLIDVPEHRVRGVLTHRRSTQPFIALDENLVDGPQLSTTHVTEHGMTITERLATAEESYAAFRPVTLHGVLDDGIAVTGLDAQDHGGTGMFARPNYGPMFLLLGAHGDATSTFTRVRFAVDMPYWLPQIWAHPNATAQTHRAGLAGVLSTESDESNWWLVYEPAEALPLREIIDYSATACLTFMTLALGHEAHLMEVQVQQDDANWVHVSGKRLWENAAQPAGSTMLAPESITLDRMATFIDLHHELDALSDPIANPVEGPIQVTLLANAAVVEGVHRRLWKHRKRFVLPPNSSLKTVRRAAREPAVKSFVEQGITDEPTATRCMNDALAYLDEISFVERVAEIVGEVETIIPEVFESVPDFARRFVDARNELAHQLVPEDEAIESLADKTDRWAVLDWVAQWMMKILVLHRTGVSSPEIAYSLIPDAVLPYHLPGNQSFGLFRARIHDIAAELAWISTE